ncbi:MAG: hypothetical protein AAF938_20730 [Myxococcota bacterium]
MSAYFQPWIVARIALSLIAAFAVLRGFVAATELLRRWHLGTSSEGQLALERRAELVSTLVSLGLAATLGALVVTLYGADRQAQTIQGAMCAYGVFEQGGFISLGVAFVAAFGCALWLMLHRLDLRFETPVLTRVKFQALYALAPLVLLDGWLFVRFAGALDLSAGGTCCSAGFSADGGAVAGFGSAFGLDALSTFALFAAFAALAGAVLFFASRRRTLIAGVSGASLGIVALFFGMGASARYVAPHVYETPHHTCPFCLLQGSYAPFGWALMLAFFGAAVFGTGSALAFALGRRGREGVDLGVTFARRASLLWVLALALCFAPVLTYYVRTGTLLI